MVAMVNMLAVVFVIVVILIGGYVIFTVYHGSPSVINNKSTYVSTIQTTLSNSSSSSTSPSPANIVYTTVMVYESDFKGNMVNFSISPSSVNVITGNYVKFIIINQGRIDHSLNITGPLSGPLNSTNYMNITNATFNVGLRSIIQPGENATLTFNAPSPGYYLIFSPVPGQEALGMRATLVVLNST